MVSSAAAKVVSSSTKRLSGLQKDVLSLYRTILRQSVQKDRSPNSSLSFTQLAFPPEQQQTTTQYARNEFRKQALSVKKMDFKRVEFKLRDGHKKLKLLQMPGVQVVRGSS